MGSIGHSEQKKFQVSHNFKLFQMANVKMLKFHNSAIERYNDVKHACDIL